MTDKPTPEDVELWQRRFAARANNRAWTLAETIDRSPAQDAEMLQAANTAMYLWRSIGTPRNHAHAAQLLAHVYALLGLPQQARQYLDKALPYFTQDDCAPLERGFAHAIAANVAHAAGDAGQHAAHYAQAQALMAQLDNPQDREALAATMRVIPAPGA
jgi:hypothetical protein